MDISGYIDIPVVVIVYLLINTIKKYVFKKDDKRRAFLPMIATILGAAIAMVIFKFVPYLTTSENILSSFASGAISGMASTGSNQIYKQLMNFFTPDLDAEDETL